MDTITIDIPMTLDVQGADLDNILTTCFEGGSNYWINKVEVDDYKGCKYASEVVSNGGDVWIYPDDSPRYFVNKERLLKGIELWFKRWITYTKLSGKNNPYLNFLNDTSIKFSNIDWDADDTDSILQYAMFGKVVYG